MISAVAIALLAIQVPDSSAALSARVEIVRTEYGVPHILAQDLRAMGYGLGYVQSEDFGLRVAGGLVNGRGTSARHPESETHTPDIDADFVSREGHARAAETWHRLDQNTRDVYEGFAQGVNQYILLHPEEFPDWMKPDFTGIDAHARDIQLWSRGDAARFVRNLTEAAESGEDADAAAEAAALDAAEAEAFALDGSNAWAFSAERTESGNAILLRNPHLNWGIDAPLNTRLLGTRYYEAHVRVPGVIEFYGDFRIGGAFGIIGGFNRHLGWATTNNYPTYSQVYALARHPDLPDHAVLDNAPVALEARTTTIDVLRDDGSLGAESRTQLWTPHGPVIHQDDDHIYILKDPRDGEWRRGEQFLRMMMASSLEEWLDIMRMRAHSSSNFTYADAAGNAVHYYNARLPLLPHEMTGDTAAFASSASDMWSELVPWESLPLYINPPGGYVQQANDTPDFTNLNVTLDRDTVAANLPEPRLRLRSQLSLDLVHTEDPAGDLLSLEAVVERKHSPRMLMAERVLDDLVSLAEETGGFDDAVRVLNAWDRTAAAESRGGVLFKLWADEYFDAPDDEARWAVEWDFERPTETPAGIAEPDAALEALSAAQTTMSQAGFALDVPWGEVHRMRLGGVDDPISGCEPGLGCFRTLSYGEAEDGKFYANRGDAWVFFVEFGEVPRAYTILSYGQSARPDSPHFDDQAALFAESGVKSISWTDADIERTMIRRYRPGVR
jgi:acyl-homoserine-lactone acylase